MANRKTLLVALKKLEKQLGITFVDPQQTLKALEHPSVFCNKTKKDKVSYFQRLEFLGDRVLSLVITNYLYTTYSQASEGELAKRLTFLIRTETLADLSLKLNLASCLKKQKESFNIQGSIPQSILADTMEVLIGHIFETMGYDVAKTIILKIWTPCLNTLKLKSLEDLKDAKSRLQEVILKKGNELPIYVSKKCDGEDHEPVFETTLTLPNTTTYKALGSSKSKAEQAAALIALNSLKKNKGKK